MPAPLAAAGSGAWGTRRCVILEEEGGGGGGTPEPWAVSLDHWDVGTFRELFGLSGMLAGLQFEIRASRNRRVLCSSIGMSSCLGNRCTAPTR
eukprot:SAG31_NODE_558_length_14153_cov_9.068094_19_plen_93_part_00